MKLCADILDDQRFILVYTLEQPVCTDPTGARQMPHSGASSLFNHGDHGLVILKDVELDVTFMGGGIRRHEINDVRN